MPPEPILRAIPEVGHTWDDPSEDLIFILLEDIEAGESTFLIIERTADTSGQTYVQASRNNDGSYIVEYRDGSVEHHYQTTAPTMHATHAALTARACELYGWRDHATWTPLT